MDLIVFRIKRHNRYSFVALEAALERAGVEATLVRSFRENRDDFLSQLYEFSRIYRKVIVAYSFMSHERKEIIKEWESLRRIENAVIVAGGSDPTGAVKHVLRGGAHFVVFGEGEEAFPFLIKHITDPYSYPLPAGVYFMKDNKIRGRKREGFPEGWEESFPFPLKNPVFSPIEITRGCPYRCSYCETSLIKGRKPRHKSLEVILEAVRFMGRFKKHDIRFISPNALSYGSPDGKEVDLHKVFSLLDGVKRLLPREGRIFFGSFPSEIRPDFVTDEAVELMKTYCDNKVVVIGAQSGSERVLKLMRRGHGVEDVLVACERLLRKGFLPAVDFIFGLPVEEADDVTKSLDLMEKLAIMGARIHAHYFMPLAGSMWAFSKPKAILPEFRRRIELLISKGKLFGQWLHQEKIYCGLD